MRSHEMLFINGGWHVARGKRHEVVNPATRQVEHTVVAADSRDVDLAVEAAEKAMPAWRGVPPAVRAEFLARIAAGIRERQEEIAGRITTEMGAPKRLAMGVHTALPAAVLDSMAAVAAEYEFERKVGNSRIRKVPLGPVAAIAPWNFPIHQLVAKIGPALLAGCTVVAKPSIEAPLSSYLLAEVIEEAGLPPGVFNLVIGSGDTVGSYLVEHPRIAAVSFTGSTEAGRKIYAAAAKRIRPVTLELGGKSASVLLTDANFPVAVKVSVANAFMNAGQTCNAWTRMVIPFSKRDEVIALVQQAVAKHILGDPRDADTRVGPLVSDAQQQSVQGYVARALAEGSTIVAGGAELPIGFGHGSYVQPTALIAASPNQEIAQEEVFGPVLCILTYDDEQEALSIANNSRYGLAGAVWSQDSERAEDFAERMETGQVDINGGAFNVLAPFGGFKLSGLGRELGLEGVDEYVQAQALQR